MNFEVTAEQLSEMGRMYGKIYWSDMAIEDRLDGMTAHDRLTGLKPQEILAEVTPHDRLTGLKPQEILAEVTTHDRLTGLKPQEILAEVTPHDRLTGLKPHDILTSLTPKALAELQEYMNKHVPSKEK